MHLNGRERERKENILCTTLFAQALQITILVNFQIVLKNWSKIQINFYDSQIWEMTDLEDDTRDELTVELLSFY